MATTMTAPELEQAQTAWVNGIERAEQALDSAYRTGNVARVEELTGELRNEMTSQTTATAASLICSECHAADGMHWRFPRCSQDTRELTEYERSAIAVHNNVLAWERQEAAAKSR